MRSPYNAPLALIDSVAQYHMFSQSVADFFTVIHTRLDSCILLPAGNMINHPMRM